jgi:hypothetical protein
MKSSRARQSVPGLNAASDPHPSFQYVYIPPAIRWLDPHNDNSRYGARHLMRIQLGLGTLTGLGIGAGLTLCFLAWPPSPSGDPGDPCPANAVCASDPGPRNVPRGTRPIDRWAIPKDDLQDIKDGTGAGPRDWVGVSPEGEVYVKGPNGKAVYAGHVDNFTKRFLEQFPRPF